MPMHSLIHPNRSGCLKMRATDAAGSGSGGTASVTAWQPESELAQLQTEVFAATGITVTADDPIMAVLIIQKRSMQAYVEQLSCDNTARQEMLTDRFQNISESALSEMQGQQEAFLQHFRQSAEQFEKMAEVFIQEAQSFQNAKQYILKEILDSNEREREKIQQTVFQKISGQIQQQYGDAIEQFSNRQEQFLNKILLLMLGALILSVSLLVIANTIWK